MCNNSCKHEIVDLDYILKLISLLDPTEVEQVKVFTETLIKLYEKGCCYEFE